MKKIVHIVNPNGLGHLRRSIFIWNNVNINKFSVKLFIDQSQNKYLSFFKPKPFISIEIMDFKGMITLSNIKNKDFTLHYFNLHERFNNSINFKEVDLLISDNTLFDFNKFCNNYLVFGSFLWYDIVKNNTSLSEVILNEKKILETNLPEIYGIKNFISESLKEYNFLHEIGWLVHQKKKLNRINPKSGILFSGGLGNMSISYINLILEKLRESSIDFDIYSSINYKFIKNSIHFDFDKDWGKIDYVIARPGLGTISDCIENNLPIIAIGETNNPEIVSNARFISECNIGFDYVNKHFDNEFLSKSENINYDSLSLNGLDEICNVIINKLNYD